MKKTVRAHIKFPGILDDYIKPCFGMFTEQRDYNYLLSNNLLDSFYRFTEELSLGRRVVSVDMFDEVRSSLDSIASLSDSRKELDRQETKRIVQVKVSEETYSLMAYSFGKIDSDDSWKADANDEGVLMHIADLSVAYAHWCMREIISSRKIGATFLFNDPHLGVEFEELPMGEYYPKYEKLRPFSLDEEEFLQRASKREIKNRLVDLIGDFKKDVVNGSSEYCLSKMSGRIRRHAQVLGWNPESFLKRARSKSPEM